MRKFDQQLLRLKSVLRVTSDQEVASLLGLSKAAFSDRKRRDAFPEDKLLALVALRPDLYIDAEYVLTGKSEREAALEAMAESMARTEKELRRDYPSLYREPVHGVGDSNTPTLAHLTADELELLELFRAASLARKMEAVRVLSGGPSAPSPESSPPPKKAPPASRAKTAPGSAGKQSGKGAKQVFHGPVGQAVEGGITNHQGVTFNVGNGKSKE